MRWFIVESWHIVDEVAGDRSHCGQILGVRTTVAAPPPQEKTCETCLRAAVKEDAPAPKRRAKEG